MDKTQIEVVADIVDLEGVEAAIRARGDDALADVAAGLRRQLEAKLAAGPDATPSGDA